MTFDEWYEKNCIKDSPGKGMYATHEGDWIYKEDCKEIWDSIMAELAAPSPEAPAVDALTTGADWRSAFDERHQFDVYPDHFMSGMRNEFCAGWHAALKSQAASQPKTPILHPASEPEAMTKGESK